MAPRFGPASPLIEELLTSLTKLRWFACAELTQTTKAMVVAELMKCAKALDTVLPDERLTTFHIEYSGDWREAMAQWRAAWLADPLFASGDASSPGAAHLRALSAAAGLARRRATETVPASMRADLDDELDARLLEVAGRTPSWCVSPGICPGQVVMSRHAEWALAFGGTPSPWAPLVALWRLGVWPLFMPGGSVLVYVPGAMKGLDPFPLCPHLPLVGGGPAPLEHLGVSASVLPATLPLAQLTDGDNERYPLGVHTPIGRDRDNVIVVKDRTVSRHQAWFVFRGGHFWVVDQQSSGGTFVDGQRVEGQMRVTPGTPFTLPAMKGTEIKLVLEVLGGLRRGSFGLVHRT